MIVLFRKSVGSNPAGSIFLLLHWTHMHVSITRYRVFVATPNALCALMDFSQP